MLLHRLRRRRKESTGGQKKGTPKKTAGQSTIRHSTQKLGTRNRIRRCGERVISLPISSPLSINVWTFLLATHDASLLRATTMSHRCPFRPLPQRKWVEASPPIIPLRSNAHTQRFSFFPPPHSVPFSFLPSFFLVSLLPNNRSSALPN